MAITEQDDNAKRRFEAKKALIRKDTQEYRAQVEANKRLDEEERWRNITIEDEYKRQGGYVFQNGFALPRDRYSPQGGPSVSFPPALGSRPVIQPGRPASGLIGAGLLRPSEPPVLRGQ